MSSESSTATWNVKAARQADVDHEHGIVLMTRGKPLVSIHFDNGFFTGQRCDGLTYLYDALPTTPEQLAATLVSNA